MISQKIKSGLQAVLMVWFYITVTLTTVGLVWIQPFIFIPAIITLVIFYEGYKLG